MESKSFHRNVFLLTQAIPPTKEFQQYFKEGMFDRPNTVGFIHVSHYLFTIYDAERFKKAVEWPIHNKKDWGKYRNEIRDFMNVVANENPDFEFPTIQPSHLHTASGTRFINLIWKFSTITMRTYLRRQGKEPLNMAPKPGEDDTLTKNLLTNLIANEKKEILELHNRISEIEKRAEIEATEMVESITNSRSQWFEVKQKLEDTVESAVIHPDIKKRMADPNDTEILQLWKDNLHKGLCYLKSQQNILNEITERSENVAATVNSVVTSDSNCLDGNNLPRINTEKLLELSSLEPETQVAVHHLYEDNQLHLPNLLQILKSLLKRCRDDAHKNSLPDLTDCNLQIAASTDDLKHLSEVLTSLHARTTELNTKINSTNQPAKNPNISIQLDPDVFDSFVLKSSPTIHLHSNNQREVYDAAERLELTPVENAHKLLFLRYQKNETPTIPRPLKARPTLLISRINFDDTMSSTISERSSPAKLPVKLFNQLSTAKTGKFSRLFASSSRRNLNNPTISSPGWKLLNENNCSSDVYNMSDLKSHLDSKSSFNLSQDLAAVNSTPEKKTAKKQVANVNKPAFNSTEIVNELSTISENQEIVITIGASPGVKRVERKDDKRRVSIGDLVEKYKKLREQSSSVTYLEQSGDNSDECTK